MQPSAFYADEAKTYAGGFTYKVTTSAIKSLYGLNDTLDNSISYTTPKNSKLDVMEMGGWNNSSASAYVDKQLYFKKDFGSSGHSNINSLTVSKGSFAEAGKTTICFAANPDAGYYYFGNSAEGSETKGSLNCKLITDMEINKIVFRATIPTGWTKEDFEAFESDGSLADNDGYEISFADFMANPSNYYIRTFTISTLGYWDGSTWKANNLSNSPQIAPIFITDNAKTTGFLSFNKHHFDNAPGTGAYGTSNISVYNSSATNATNVNSWQRGAVVSGLSSSSGYILGEADTILLTPDLTGVECADLTSQGVLGAGTTLPAKTLPFWDALKVYKYDQYTLTADSGSSGPSHFTRYNYYFCVGMRGDYLYKLLAYIGAYFYTGSLTDLNDSGATPDNMAVTGMKLGEMDADGNTTGNWIGPDAMPAYQGINKGGSIVHPGYNPSGGGGGGGYDDDPWHGISFSGVGVGGAGAFAKCYYMTSTELANLRSWMNSNNVPEGFDPMAQIIGLSQVPVSLSGDDNSTVQFVNSSAVYDPGVTRLVDSGVTTQIAMGTPIRYSLGSVDIVRRMQERGEPYLDYDCQIELYLPLIGMFSLDTQAVMGRKITAEAVLDPISGTLAAYAYVSRDGQNLPIAYGSTTIGVDLPISAQQYSVSRAALKQANAQLGSSILSSTLSFIAAATAGGKGSGTGAKTATGTTNGLAAAGIREAGADYMKASQAGNVFGDFMQWGRTIRQLSYGNNTAIAGSFGGSTAQWAYPFTPYVKIIRPRYEKPSNYAHSQGVPCVQTKTVGSCTGFIQCIGVDVSGISGATDLELQAIQAALSNGIFAGGGQ